MICCNIRCRGKGEEAHTRRATLSFHRRELLYDIANIAYVEGHIMPEEQECIRHITTDIAEEGNVDRVSRILDIVHSEVTELLYPFSKINAASEEEVIDDRLMTPHTYIIELTIPATFSRTTLRLLSRLIHEYMVCRVVADWLSITAPQASQRWLEKSRNVEEQIQSAKHMRGKPLRRALHPF